MLQLLSLLDNALLQGLSYGVAVTGIAMAFRICRYPDLTADGSFLLGSTVFTALLIAGYHWVFATVGACLAGCLAGAVTSLMNSKLGVNRLLSGILTSMMAYSIGFRVLSGQSVVALGERSTIFSMTNAWDAMSWSRSLGCRPGSLVVSLGLAAAVAVFVLLLLRSEVGLLLRATGENRPYVERLGKRPDRYQFVSLVVANALVALCGVVVTSRQGFSNISMGFGITITLIAALVLGEEVLKRLRFDPTSRLSARVVSPIVGGFTYFLLYLIILRASIRGWIPLSIQPTDLKLLSAGIVVLVILIRRKARPDSEEVLPI